MSESDWVVSVDQSINGFAMCCTNVLDPLDFEVVMVESDVKSWTYKLANLVERSSSRIDDWSRTRNVVAITMEDYARGSRSSSITKLTELGGAFKLMVASKHTEQTYGVEDFDTAKGCRFWVQGQSKMKKFSLGNGSTKKDSSYLLKAYSATQEQLGKGLSFDNDDNKADAWMHSWLATSVVNVVTGRKEVPEFTRPQQETLVSEGIPVKTKTAAAFKKYLGGDNDSLRDLVIRGFSAEK